MWPPSSSNHGCHKRELYVKLRRTFRPRPGKDSTGTVSWKLLLPAAATVGRSIKLGSSAEILAATGSRPRLFFGANAVLMVSLFQPRMTGPNSWRPNIGRPPPRQPAMGFDSVIG